MRKIPQVVQDVNVFVNGQGYLGYAKSVGVPTIEQEMIESKGAISASFATGTFKPCEIEFKIAKIDANMYATLSLNNFTSRVPFLFKASLYEPSKNKTVPFSMAITGDIISIAVKELGAGEEMEVTIKVAVHFLDINVESIPMILFDVENMIYLVGGVDYLANVRANLSE